MRVYVNTGTAGERKLVDAELVKRNRKTVLVELLAKRRRVVKRKIARDLPADERP